MCVLSYACVSPHLYTHTHSWIMRRQEKEKTSSVLVNMVVDMSAPETAAQEVQKQSLDPCSKLRSGKVTKFIEKVSLKKQSDMQGSPLWATEVYIHI